MLYIGFTSKALFDIALHDCVCVTQNITKSAFSNLNFLNNSSKRPLISCFLYIFIKNARFLNILRKNKSTPI